MAAREHKDKNKAARNIPHWQPQSIFVHTAHRHATAHLQEKLCHSRQLPPSALELLSRKHKVGNGQAHFMEELHLLAGQQL